MNAVDISSDFSAPPLGFTEVSEENKEFCKPGTIIQAEYIIPCTRCIDQHFAYGLHSKNQPHEHTIDCWSNLLILDAWERVEFGTYGPIKHWHVVLLKALENERTVYLKLAKTNGWVNMKEYFSIIHAPKVKSTITIYK